MSARVITGALVLAVAGAAHAAASIQAGGYVLRWDERDLSVSPLGEETPTFSAAALARSGFDAFSRGQVNQGGCTYTRSFRVVSFLPPYLSVEDTLELSCPGWRLEAAPQRRFTTVDLSRPGPLPFLAHTQDLDPDSTGPAVSLERLFGERQVLAALKGAPVIARTLREVGQPEPPSARAIPGLLVGHFVSEGSCLYELPPDFLTRIALTPAPRSQVQATVALPATPGGCLGKTLKLELVLEPPAGFEPALRAGAEASRKLDPPRGPTVFRFHTPEKHP